MKSVTSFFCKHKHHVCATLVILSIFLFSIDIVLASDTLDHTLQEKKGGSSWIANSLANMVLGIALGIGGIFSWLGGMLLNGAVTYTILNAGNIIGNTTGSGLGTGIRSMWVVIRDIFNIVFIFAFIYIGIKTILNADDSGAKRSLGLLIVAALLINFSLYFAQVIIDFSNIAAVQVYNQITDGGVLIPAGLPNDPAGGALIPADYGVSGAFANTIRLTSFFGGGEIQGIGPGQILLYALMAMVFLIIAGIVFAMGGILLIRRFISLVICMILSPVMFAGWIFPAFMGYQEKWRKVFLEQAFFAPAFLFMIYLSLVVLQSLRTTFGITTTGYSSMLRTGDVDAFSIFLFFCIGIGFLYASIKVGEMMSIAGASGMASSLKAGGKYFSGAAQSFAYRNTAGRGLNWGVKQLDKLDQAADKGNRSARFLRAVGVDESVRRSLDGASNKGIDGGRGREAVEKDQKTAKARSSRTTQITTISDAIKAGAGAGPNTLERNNMERAVKDASSAQILEMFKDDKGKINSIAGELSDSQVKAIMDDKEIDDADKASLGKERGRQIAERLVNGLPAVAPGVAANTIAEAIGKADASELSALGFDTAKANAGKLTAKQIEDWKDLTTTEKKQLKDARKSALEVEFGVPIGTPAPAVGVPFGTAAGATAIFRRITNDEERSKLPNSILTSDHSAQYLNTNVLTKIVDNPGITDTERTQIKSQVMLKYPVGHAERAKYLKFFNQNNAGQRY